MSRYAHTTERLSTDGSREYPARRLGAAALAPLVMLVHHGETPKNKQDRHGAVAGSEYLTPTGVWQAERLGQFAGAIVTNHYRNGDDRPAGAPLLNIVTAHHPRLQHTAVVMRRAAEEVIGRADGDHPPTTRLTIWPDFRGIGMGPWLNGASDDEIAERFPKFAASWGEWRHHMTDVPPVIPGGETAAGLMTRTRRGMDRALNLGAAVVAVVCSNSVIAALDYTMRHPEQRRWDTGQEVHMPYVDAPLGSYELWKQKGGVWAATAADFQPPNMQQLLVPQAPIEPDYVH